MAFTEYAKVKNVLIANTKFGKKKVCNVITDQGDEAIWAEDLSAFSHIKAGQQIEVIRGVKGKLTILERSAASPQEPLRNFNSAIFRSHTSCLLLRQTYLRFNFSLVASNTGSSPGDLSSRNIFHHTTSSANNSV